MYISKQTITSFDLPNGLKTSDFSGTMSQSQTVDSNLSDIKDFLSRPVRLSSHTWTPGSSIAVGYNPWSTFLNSAVVKQKIATFSRIRAKLHLRFMLNTNSFYFGSLVASYVPCYPNEEITLTRTATAPYSADFVEIMQRPLVYFDASIASTKDFVLPFFYPLDYYSLVGDSALAPPIGYLFLNDLNLLRHANGGTDPVYISVYAWMSDVELCVPTSFVSAMELSQDQKAGPGSKLCSAVSDIAGTLSVIPGLAPFTTPVKAAADLGYSVAKNLGFARPENTKAIESVQPNYCPSYAVTDRSDLAEVMALDSANTLSVDPESVNLNEDEMSLLTLSKKWSYIRSFTISGDSIDPADSLIASACVRPILPIIRATGGAGYSEYHYPIISYCSLPFRYWRGTLRFKFQFVASGFHTGRFRIVWDPQPASTQSSGDYFGTVYTQIVDLEGDRDFIFEIPYANSAPFLKNYNAEGTYDGTQAVPNQGIDNGVLSVYVLNSVVSPNTTAFNPIYMNLYISCGDDFVLADPNSDAISNLSFFSAMDRGEETSAEDQQESVTILKSEPYPYALVANGEVVMSIRALTKRVSQSYVCYLYLASSAGTGLVDVSLTDYDRPIFYGKDPNGRHISANLNSYNICSNNFITFFEPCFAARRGGYKVKIIPRILNSSSFFGGVHSWTVKREGGHTGCYAAAIGKNLYTALNTDYIANWALNDMNSGFEATQYRAGSNFIHDMSLPYYGTQKFLHSRYIRNPSSSFAMGDNAWGNSTEFRLLFEGAASTSYRVTLTKLVSTRDDYSLFFFVSTPVCYFYALPSA